jgi:hypothetical protein
MWRPETPAIPHGRLIEELLVRVDRLRQAAPRAEARIDESIRQWAAELESEIHTLVMRSWTAR